MYHSTCTNVCITGVHSHKRKSNEYGVSKIIIHVGHPLAVMLKKNYQYIAINCYIITDFINPSFYTLWSRSLT